MGTRKQIDIKNRTYYFYNNMINIKKFDARLLKIDKRSYNARLLKIDKRSYKDIGIYDIGYNTNKKLAIVKIFTVLILYIYLLIMQMDIWKKKA